MKNEKCIWATNTYALDYSGDDLTIARIKYKDEDGNIKSRLKFIENYQRPFWITKPQFRTHKNYKDVERMEFCDEYRCNQAKLTKTLQKALKGNNFGYVKMKELLESPYVYGAEQVGSSYFVSDFNKDTNPEFSFYSKVGVLDYETAMRPNMGKDETGEPIMAGYTCDGNWILVVNSYWYNTDNLEHKVIEATKRLLPDIYNNVKPNIKVILVDGATEVTDTIFKEIHKDDPDLLVSWNAGFDMKVAINSASDAGKVLSHPKVPPKYQQVRYNQGREFKQKENGQLVSKDRADIWNTIDIPAGFIWADAMCYYRTSRLHLPKLPSYSLDYILKHEGLEGKLKIKELQHLEGTPEWHIEAQKRFPIEYMVYCLQDNYGLEALQDKTLDFKVNFLMDMELAPIARMQSNPTKLAYDFNQYLRREENCVLGTTSEKNILEIEQDVLNREDWIRILNLERFVGHGTSIIDGISDDESRMVFQANDNDIAAGYVNIGIVTNVSKGTTMCEVINIDGLTEKKQRKIGYELTAMKTNVVEICNDVLKLPTIDKALELL